MGAQRIGGVVAVLMIAAGLAVGEDLREIATIFSQNRDRLRAYVWTTRTEWILDGQVQAVQLHRVGYDDRGDPERTLLPAPPGSATPKRQSAKKQRRQQELVDGLRELIESYVLPDPRTARQMFAEATVWEGEGRTEGVTRIRARNVVRQGDEIGLWLDTATRTPQRLEILTSSAGEPVKVSTAFRALEGGPFYPARVVLETEIKEKKLVLTSESFDLVLRGS